MFSTNLYINNLNKRKKQKQKYESFYFALVFGLILFFISIFRLITDSNVNNDKFYICLFILSLITFFFLIFIPNKIKYLKKPLSFIGEFVCRILLSILLLFVYIIWFIPASFINHFKQDKKNTSFIKKEKCIVKITNNNIFCQVKNIFAYFIFAGNWYLIPLLIILIVIGLILFFAQSSAITPLIYPLI